MEQQQFRPRLARCIPFLAACLFAGCNSLALNTPAIERLNRIEKDPSVALPSKHSFRLSQYAFISDIELDRKLPIFQELAEMRDQVHKQLLLPSASEVVQVYIFEDRDRYERFMRVRYPDLPKRRAFFIAQPHRGGIPEDLLVYTYWGDRIREDLRHELTHALLHSVLKDVPLWLDEGLAEYFEVPPEKKGINTGYLEQLRRGNSGFKPDMTRLEQLSQVQQMTPAEYRESWAWVHLMLDDKPEAKKALLAYLNILRTNPKAGLLQPRLAAVYPAPNEALDKHLVSLEARQIQ